MLTLALVAAVAPAAARSQTNPTFGSGPNGYDYMIGTWSCVNGMSQSSMGMPPHQTLTVSKSSGAMFFHTTSNNLDISSYNVYVPKKKLWVSPFVGSDGTYGMESTAQTGKTVVWTGTLYDPGSGTTLPTRDTYTNAAAKYVDVGENQINGTWKTEYRVTCTKS